MKRRRAQQAMVKPAVAILLVLLLIIGVSWASCRKKKAAQTSAVQLTTDVIIAEVEGLVMGRKFNEELGVPLFAPRQE